MFRIGSQAFGEVSQSTLPVERPEDFYEWDITLYYNDNGKKKTWHLGQDDSPIKQITFELNDHICGSGSIEFSFLDFPIDADDYILIRNKGRNVYRALINNTVDPKGGKIKLEPYSVRLRELLVNNTFTTKTISEILQTLITENQSDTNIEWVPSLIDTGDTDTFTLDYSGYENIRKIIDELVGKLDDRFWGVNADNQFSVYTLDTNVTEDYFYTIDPKYTQIDEKKNWSKIKGTRYQVFKKTAGGGESERIGQVGYGSGYPVLDIEDLIRKKEIKFNVSEVIASDSEALGIAYQNLIVKTQVPQNIKVKNFDVNELLDNVGVNPIGKRIKVQDREEIILRTIINCDALTDDDTTMATGAWQYATLDTSIFVNGSASISFTSGSIIYDFGRIVSFKEPTKIGFMIRGTIAGEYLEMSTGKEFQGWSTGSWSSGNWSINASSTDELWDTTKTVNIATGSLWAYVDFNVIDTEFRYFGIRFTDSTVSTINVDRIQLYVSDRSEYEQNIKKIIIDIKPDMVDSQVELNKYDLQVNDILFASDRRIEKLEAINQAT